MSTNYEPSAEAVEALAKELHGVRNNGLMENVACFVLRRQHEREKPLLELLRGARPTIGKADVLINDRERVEALVAHAKIDAPRVPTLAECEAELVEAALAFGAYVSTGAAFDRFVSAKNAVKIARKAAVEREERR